jgi:phage tail-like protein
MPPSDVLTAARFSITVDGYSIASFSELVGIASEVEPLDSADQVVDTRKLPGRRKPPTVTLRRGQTSELELWAWHEAVVSGDVAAGRKDCTLVMYAVDGKPVARYYLEHAWPSKLEVGALKAGPAEALYETVTLVCERLQRLAP